MLKERTAGLSGSDSEYFHSYPAVSKQVFVTMGIRVSLCFDKPLNPFVLILCGMYLYASSM